MSVFCSASEIRIGDVISGPDGASTVVDIVHENGTIKFDFAEGNGNRCWSGILPDEAITRFKATNLDISCGFLVNRKGEVLRSGIVEVSIGSLTIDFKYLTKDYRIKNATIKKEKIGHIIGQFTLRFT